MDKTSRNVLLIFLFVLIFIVLETLSSLLIPLALAFLFAVIFQPPILFLKRHKIPGFIIYPVVAGVTLGIVFLVADLFVRSAYDIYDQRELMGKQITDKAQYAVYWLNRNLNLSISWRVIEKSVTDMFTTKMLTQSAGLLASEIGSFTASFFMFALYYVVLLTGLSKYKEFLSYVGGETQSIKFIDNYEKVQKSINSYLLIKTGVNICQGLIVWGVCSAFGMKFAPVLGFVAFVIHFIPNIGSILSTVLPGLLALIQFDEANTIVTVIAVLGTAQFLMGNFIEPLIAGHQLQLNTVTVIFGLVFWGWLWGIAGMMMSVPLMVIIKLVLEQIPDLSFLGRLMGVAEKKKKKKASPPPAEPEIESANE